MDDIVQEVQDATLRGVADQEAKAAFEKQTAAAKAFYLAIGFEPEQELTVLGQPMTYLTKRVASESRP